ncbi:dTDP-4-dehydrorhamnose reductase [Spongiivirga citrea]|uniref:dTDP-4-dehydrorhamnose reductase n=1 Tax=Spongiivirga citrea TaxID=1481457 RepID=A0A6M0CLU3_9FLAO|nr:dTDP-4-dehydrorhamnose reductase [Spongiivirga citrea]NER18905.1 dTDP-4-dehydrorhamnose reductase [Spongiivirga citrea]
MISVLVTGANGQLGKCLQDIVIQKHRDLEWVFKTSEELDITDQKCVLKLFDENEFDYLVNCAAYTAVDRAESEKEKAFLINAEAVKYLAETCKINDTKLVHISTDFVFDGTNDKAYTEEDTASPLNMYGASKLKGEQYIQGILEHFFIIRTSWVYSEYGHNFVKTMLRLGKERDQINVVNDQVGSPTYAKDLAAVIIEIVKSEYTEYGLYHYSNGGVISWFDFTKKIFEYSNIQTDVFPVSSADYITHAKRPKNSALDKAKISNQLKSTIPNWQESLKKCINSIINEKA